MELAILVHCSLRKREGLGRTPTAVGHPTMIFYRNAAGRVARRPIPRRVGRSGENLKKYFYHIVKSIAGQTFPFGGQLPMWRNH